MSVTILATASRNNPRDGAFAVAETEKYGRLAITAAGRTFPSAVEFAKALGHAKGSKVRRFLRAGGTVEACYAKFGPYRDGVTAPAPVGTVEAVTAQIAALAATNPDLAAQLAALLSGAENITLPSVPVEGADVAPVEGADVAPVEGADVAPVEGADVAPVEGADVAPVEGADVAPVEAPARNVRRRK